MELMNPPQRTEVTWLPFILGCFAGMGPWIVVFMYFLGGGGWVGRMHADWVEPAPCLKRCLPPKNPFRELWRYPYLRLWHSRGLPYFF